ncbi:dialkylresorcinol condensing enzyme [Xenophilus arseniciresistens]|uniref:Dialkylresorcinol condensing enzyme n=1 Tax=Xenophilus arseniciresistens TaxID=1283306 RepID=A0AAE3SZB0_9BURK|nr:dialkylrecorsinol condensing enzyme [Xenophilus arseniciresistens]MDA7416360.1 dialkylresorcinol condensing enzyme [Xenophilus arseniciresistens]
MTTDLQSPAQVPKRVLVLRYSQTGQLDAVTDRLIAPLRTDPALSLTELRLVPQTPFPCPWPLLRFFDAFPESAHLAPGPLQPLALSSDERFDLVILPWQVWFLAPSQPITAFLQHPLAARVLRGVPVVSVIACRNMWMLAFDKLRGLLEGCGARLIDNVVLTDPGPTWATFITTPRWLLTGRRNAFWGMPAAGLNAAQIEGCARFGHALRAALARGDERGSGPLLAGLGAVRADARLYVSEKAGTRSFYLWGKLIRAVGGAGSAARQPLVALYVLFLIVLILTVVPISMTVQALARPWCRGWLHRIRAQYELPSGSATASDAPAASDRCPPP